jgi:hypothetical protein
MVPEFLDTDIFNLSTEHWDIDLARLTWELSYSGLMMFLSCS